MSVRYFIKKSCINMKNVYADILFAKFVYAYFLPSRNGNTVDSIYV